MSLSTVSIATVDKPSVHRTFLQNVERGCFLLIALNQIVGVFDPPEAFFLDPQAYSQDVGGAGGNRPVPLTTAISHLMEAFTIFLLLRHWRAYVAIIRRSPLVLLQVLVIVGSTLWSIGPTNSLRSSLHCLIDFVLALHIVYSYSAIGFTSLFVRLSAIGAVVSFVLLVAFPAISHEVAGGAYGGAWRGAYENKNFLGATTSISVVIAGYSFVSAANDRRFALFVMLANLVLLLGSRSSTAIVATAACLPILFLIGIAQKPGATIFTVTFTLGCICFLSAALLSVHDPLALLGKDSTLTGRTAVWHAVIPLIRQRLLLGYGLAFWDIDSDWRNDIWTAANWNAPHAHNDYLDLLLQTGVLGFIVAVGNYVICICLSLRFLPRIRDGAVLFLMLILNFVVRGLAETLTTSPATPQLALLYVAEMGLWLLAISPRSIRVSDQVSADRLSSGPPSIRRARAEAEYGMGTK